MVTWIPHLYTMPHRCRPSVVAFWQFPRWFIDDWPGKPGGLGWRSWFVYLSWNYQVKEIEKAWQIACNCTFFELLILFQGPTFSFQTHSLSFLYGHWCWVAVCMTKTEATTKSIRKWNLLSWCWCSLRQILTSRKSSKKSCQTPEALRSPECLGGVWNVARIHFAKSFTISIYLLNWTAGIGLWFSWL